MTQTGPRSPEAKARVSTNAVRHGLRSLKVVIAGLELQADWDRFLADSIDALKPKGAIEYALAERVTSLIWRLRRVPRAERDAANRGGHIAPEEEEDSAGVRAWEHIRKTADQLFPPGEGQSPVPALGPVIHRAATVLPALLELQILSGYEQRLSQQMAQAMHELQALQDRRRDGDAPFAQVEIQVESPRRRATRRAKGPAKGRKRARPKKRAVVTNNRSPPGPV